MRDRIRISLGAVWDETAAFVRAEAGLVAPLALLGFGMPMVVLTLLLPPDFGLNGKIDPQPWMAWLPVHGLFSLVGTLSISALALAPGISVREALTLAMRRLPTAIGAVLIGFCMLVALSVPVSIIAGIEMAIGGKPGPISLIAYLFVLGIMVWLAIRLMPLWARLVDGQENSWASMQAALRLSGGHYAKLLLLRVILIACQFGVMFVLVMPVAAVLGLIGKAAGIEAETRLVSLLINSAIFSVLLAVWTVYVARLSRALIAARAGR